MSEYSKMSDYAKAHAVLGVALKRGNPGSDLRKFLQAEGLIKTQITEKGKDLVLSVFWKLKHKNQEKE